LTESPRNSDSGTATFFFFFVVVVATATPSRHTHRDTRRRQHMHPLTTHGTRKRPFNINVDSSARAQQVRTARKTHQTTYC
jgi:hypothetical protein